LGPSCAGNFKPAIFRRLRAAAHTTPVYASQRRCRRFIVSGKHRCVEIEVYAKGTGE
jgi:hypothetical protein